MERNGRWRSLVSELIGESSITAKRGVNIGVFKFGDGKWKKKGAKRHSYPWINELIWRPNLNRFTKRFGPVKRKEMTSQTGLY